VTTDPDDGMEDLLAGGFERQLTRSEINRRNRTTRRGQSAHPLYEVCRAVLRHTEHPVCDEWFDQEGELPGAGMDRFMASVMETCGRRPSIRHRLAPLSSDIGFRPGFVCRLERAATEKEMRALERATDFRDCICEWRVIHDCTCGYGRAVHAGDIDADDAATKIVDPEQW
jgi:hypothetical protein